MNAVIYARLSAADHTPGSQIDACKAYAADEGLTVVKKFFDSSEGAPPIPTGLLNLIGEAPNGGFQVVIVSDANRIARDQLMTAMIVQILDRFGIKVVVAS